MERRNEGTRASFQHSERHQHFCDGATKAQRGQETCLRSHGKLPFIFSSQLGRHVDSTPL